MLEILISSSVLILVLAILRLVLRDRISARLQYALWLVVLVRLLVPVSFFRSPVSVAEAVRPVTERVETVSDAILTTGPNYPGEQTLSEIVSVDVPDQAIIPVWTTLDAARYVWYAGMLLMAAWFLFVNLRMALRLRRSRTPYVKEHTPPVYVADGIPSPCLFGLFRPAIYLTEQAASDPAQARQIVAHERTHLRHGDLIWSLLRSVCLAVWWFNPLVWLAAALSRQDAELACDEGAIAELGEAVRFEYGRTLIAMAKVGAKPSDLLCGATTMTGGRTSLRARVARIAAAPKTSLAVSAAALLIAALAVGCTYAGPSQSAQLPEQEIAEELPTAETASATDADALPAAYSVTVFFPDSGEILSETFTDRAELQELFALYSDLKALARPLESGDVFSDAEMNYTVRFCQSSDADLTPSDPYTGFQMWEDGTFLLFDSDAGGSPIGVCESQIYADAFLDMMDEYLSESAEAVSVGGVSLGSYDRAYWEEVDRELASFAYSADIEISVADDFDEAIPEDSIFGPLKLEDYIFGTDGWKFEYDGERIANEPIASIVVHDADGRSLRIMDDADALMIEEADGSVTWVTYADDPVDCADMIRHLLLWARGEYPTEEELRAAGEDAAKAALAELGYYGLPDLEPVEMAGGETTPFWADLTELPTGPYVTLCYGTDDYSIDLHYERLYEDDEHTRPLGAEAYEKCRSFFAASETVSDLALDSQRGFVTDGSVYAGPRIVWYHEANDLLFSMIAHHCEGGQSLDSYSTEELIALAQSVALR